MNRTQRTGWLGGLVVFAVVFAAFAGLGLGIASVNADQPLTVQERLEAAVGFTQVAVPWMIAAQLLWWAWWGLAGAKLFAVDGPARLLAAAAATLPEDRRDWGAAMTAELARVQGSSARWRFAAGCARTAIFPPRGNQKAVGVAGTLVVAAVAATTLATGAMPAMRVFALTLVGLVGGLAILKVARSRRVGWAGAGMGVAGLALTGVAGCVVATVYYVINYPLVRVTYPPATSASLTPVTAVVFAVLLAGCVRVAVTPPRWLAVSRPARRFGVGMAVAMGAGVVVMSRLALRGAGPDDLYGTMGYLFSVPIVVLLPGSAVAAAVGRSLRAGLGACAWALVLGGPLVVVAWLAEAPLVYQRLGSLLLDGDAGQGVGTNLGDAVWWTLGALLVWALPFGVIGAAAGSARARRRRLRTSSS